MRLDEVDVLNERRPTGAAQVAAEVDWPEILAASLTRVAERRDQERRAQERREREERTRYSFD